MAAREVLRDARGDAQKRRHAGALTGLRAPRRVPDELAGAHVHRTRLSRRTARSIHSFATRPGHAAACNDGGLTTAEARQEVTRAAAPGCQW